MTLPPKRELITATVQSKMITKITCPNCEHSWEVVDDNLDNPYKSDPFNVIEQCPKCSKWLILFDDPVAIDMFYEDHEDSRESDD